MSGKPKKCRHCSGLIDFKLREVFIRGHHRSKYIAVNWGDGKPHSKRCYENLIEINQKIHREREDAQKRAASPVIQPPSQQELFKC